MAARKAATVDRYIASRPIAVQKVLKQLRRILRKALPGAEETISYQIPAYRLRGTTVLFFAGWKEHCSLYPANSRFVAAFKNELAPYELSRGTIKFPLSEPIPETLITRIAKFRAKEVAETPKAKPAKASKARPHHTRKKSDADARTKFRKKS